MFKLALFTLTGKQFKIILPFFNRQIPIRNKEMKIPFKIKEARAIKNQIFWGPLEIGVGTTGVGTTGVGTTGVTGETGETGVGVGKTVVLSELIFSNKHLTKKINIRVCFWQHWLKKSTYSIWGPQFADIGWDISTGQIPMQTSANFPQDAKSGWKQNWGTIGNFSQDFNTKSGFPYSWQDWE